MGALWRRYAHPYKTLSFVKNSLPDSSLTASVWSASLVDVDPVSVSRLLRLALSGSE